MTDQNQTDPDPNRAVTSTNLQAPAVTRVPQYRRDLFPTNILLSANDLADFCRLLEDVNERAKNIEFNNLDLTGFESAQQARDRVNELIRIEYNYVAANGDSIRGLGIPRTDDHNFPNELRSFFVSNTSYTRRAINVEPLCVVDVFFSFAKPSLKIDLQTFPSNPTENRSVINVYGRDEDWVISTTERIQEFLRQKKSFRPAIHGSGVYDYLVYLAFLPALIWLALKKGGSFLGWLSGQTIFLNVIIGIYALLLSLLFARFVFQYVRWLFPPMEYYKQSRVGAYTHRIIFGAVLSAVILSAAYELAKWALFAIF